MATTMSAHRTVDLRTSSVAEITESKPQRCSFSIEIEHLGDATRLARCASALANPTSVALVTASVDNRVIYPASPEAATSGSVVRLEFATRDHHHVIDQSVVDRLVAALGGHGVVLAVHHS